MEKCIRNEDGSPISSAQWRAIKLTARTVALSHLLSLPISNTQIPRTKIHYRQHHFNAWTTAVHDLEDRQPLLRLCESSWKAEHVLGATLLASASDAKQKKKKQKIKNMLSSDEEEGDEEGALSSVAGHDIIITDNSSILQASQARPSKKRRKESMFDASKKRPKLDSQILTPIQDQLSLLSGSKPGTAGPSTPALTVPAVKSSLTNHPDIDHIDISFIRVEPSCKLTSTYDCRLLHLFSLAGSSLRGKEGINDLVFSID